MFKDNALLAQLKQDIQQTLPKIEGRVKATDKSYGFLETEKKSYFIAPPMMKKVMHGDIIEAHLREDKGKEQAEPLNLVSPAVKHFIAQVSKQKNKIMLMPPAPYRGPAIETQTDSNINVTPGDYVQATIIQHPLKQTEPAGKFLAKIDNVIAKEDAIDTPWLVSLAKYNLLNPEQTLPTQSPEDTGEWQFDESIARDDLSEQLFFTIDGPSTKDMDDAINICQLANGHWQLQVAVADPSAYIAPGSGEDQEAAARGYTHYLPKRVISMLPESLSYDLCSLVEGEKRPAVVCKMQITSRGKLLENPTFSLAYITSAAKLNYQQVTEYIDDQSTWQPSSELGKALTQLSELAFARNCWRAKNTQLFDSRPDYRLVLNDDLRIESVDVQHQSIAQSMIEEAMLLANISGGQLLQQQANKGIFNTHPGFEAEKVVKLTKLLAEHDYTYHPQHLLTTAGFCQLQREMTSRNDNYLAARLRKFQNYANISHQPEPHHGLGVEQYATWTSPIRKYGDLLNHRLLKAIIAGQPDQVTIKAAQAELLKQQRDNQRVVERDINNWLYIEYLAHAVSDETVFKGEIFNVNRGGCMVKLDENGAVIFIPSTTFAKDRKSIKIDTELGTISVNDQIINRITDKVTIVITNGNKDKLSLTGKIT
ncbi:exoribonuclease II [Psychrobium sp. 1_MG-2023]|uniref:exoribonuclease II n=1 Tax=Psychrobium sp. 1_MG-2023 TaxID=3062624 RepID=UPI000C33DC06|nr:exoribonuclease II [Psychrobium sp. 1_MG-2023]MDP2562410.1 exoribonuclease II [Psychrobium sp. 1_MG-2023]PKF56139.1 exoribonuclease II [Alteromonadales bacterium alter-6D02]